MMLIYVTSNKATTFYLGPGNTGGIHGHIWLLRDTEMIKMAMMENEKKRQRSREGLFQGSLIENAVYRPPKSTCVDLGPANKYNKQLLDLGPKNKPWQRRSFN